MRVCSHCVQRYSLDTGAVKRAEVEQRAGRSHIGRVPSTWRVFVILRKPSTDGTDNAPAPSRLGIRHTARTSRVSG